MSDATTFDRYLSDDGPAALVIREWLMPVEGNDGVLFPATYAEIGYNIDTDATGRTVCLVDSVGSQANRIEPRFKDEKYRHLVPQIVVKAGEKEVSLLEAGHRAGDALVRCSSLQEQLQAAFKSLLKGDAEPLAKVAPTSLVFGVWDSRDTQAKLPRLIASTIRAYDIRPLTRSANYLVQQQVDYIRDGIMPDWEDLPEGEKKKLSEKGYQNALANRSHGGVIADGGVRRDATLSLAALRQLGVREGSGTEPMSSDRTRALRRYILGLSLVAFTYKPGGYLRQGCLLVLDPNRAKENEFVEVYPSGERKPAQITHDAALTYAEIVAREFGVGASKTVPFETERAKKDLKGEGGTKSKGRRGTKKGETTSEAEGGK